jgi:hypothetical protein
MLQSWITHPDAVDPLNWGRSPTRADGHTFSSKEPSVQSAWIERDGHRVMYLDYSGFRSDTNALRAEVESADREVCRQPRGSVLAIANLSDTTASSAAVELFKQSVSRTKPYVDKLALIGITGLKRFLAEMVARVTGREMRLFDAEADAIAWLLGNSDAGVRIGGSRAPTRAAIAHDHSPGGVLPG